MPLEQYRSVKIKLLSGEEIYASVADIRVSEAGNITITRYHRTLTGRLVTSKLLVMERAIAMLEYYDLQRADDGPPSAV
jgi:hypothetical protein